MAGRTDEKRELTEAVENIDRMMAVIGIKSWLALGMVLLVFTAALVWGFFGTMQIREEVTGVLVRSGRIIDIYAADEGVLLDFVPAQGMFVEKDQVLARIERYDLVLEINALLDSGAPVSLIEEKRAKLLHESQIVTWEAGRVLDAYAHRGDYVRRGQKLVAISKEAEKSKALECLLYIPANQMRQIKKGLPVSVYPASISRQAYGNMIGTVSIIGEYPVTRQYLYDRLNSENLADHFLDDDSACYEVYLNLVSSEETVTGYEWTTSLGPSKTFGNLTLCTASIVIDELRPIDVFFLGR
jgi:multidrug resistance efflux pump